MSCKKTYFDKKLDFIKINEKGLVVHMIFKWIQHSTKAGEMQKWSLVNRESKVIVLDMWFSPYADDRQNYKLRKKIQTAYELYFQKVWFGAITF